MGSVIMNTIGEVLGLFGLFVMFGFIIIVCGDFYHWFYKLLGKY